VRWPPPLFPPFSYTMNDKSLLPPSFAFSSLCRSWRRGCWPLSFFLPTAASGHDSFFLSFYARPPLTRYTRSGLPSSPRSPFFFFFFSPHRQHHEELFSFSFLTLSSFAGAAGPLPFLNSPSLSFPLSPASPGRRKSRSIDPFSLPPFLGNKDRSAGSFFSFSLTELPPFED